MNSIPIVLTFILHLSFGLQMTGDAHYTDSCVSCRKGRKKTLNQQIFLRKTLVHRSESVIWESVHPFILSELLAKNPAQKGIEKEEITIKIGGF